MVQLEAQVLTQYQLHKVRIGSMNFECICLRLIHTALMELRVTRSAYKLNGAVHVT